MSTAPSTTTPRRSLVSPVLRAELRDSAPAWVAVGLTFVATTFALALSVMLLETGLETIDPALGLDSDGSYYAATGGVNLLLSALVGASVIGASTGLVVAARRPALARLALAGATPGQIVRLILGQLVVVTVLAAVAGTLLAALALDPVIEAMAADRGGEGGPAPTGVIRPASLLMVALGAAALAALGGLRQARAASLVSPLEAQREATTGASRQSRTALVLRLLAVLALTGAVVAALVGTPQIVEALGERAGELILQLSVGVLVLAGVALATAAPLIVGPLTALWTRLVPGRSATWHLARRTVVVRSDRLVRSVVPVMFSVGLVLGMVAIGATFNATFKANGMPLLSGVSTVSVLSLIGVALLISTAGAVGNLVMMSRARESELAVAGLVGATPAQRLGVTVLEAVILSVTGTLLALAMVASAVGVLLLGLPQLLPEAAFEIPVTGALVILAIVTTAAVLATSLPVLRSLRLPERTVVASRIAD